MRAPNVLVVDDVPRNLALLRDLSMQVGSRVTTARDGVEALERCRAAPFDLIVTDVHMPRMDAYAFLPVLRRMDAYVDTPVIVVTSDVSRRTRLGLLEAGADDFLLKPVDADEYRSRLRRHLHKGELVVDLVVTRGERDRALEELAGRNAELERLLTGVVAALEGANVYNDSDTGFHIRRVCAYAEMLALRHGCDQGFATQLRHYAGLHDVGKVGIRDAILKKPGKLTPEEFEEMKQHTLIGFELLRGSGLPEMAAQIALSHHERWDGRGYPRGVAGEAIPLAARITAVCDVFDALMSRRCYKEPYAFDKVVDILEESAGSHLDPTLVREFLAEKTELLAVRARFSSGDDQGADWG